MPDSGEIKPTAWQPLTPRGVAAFAHATWGRLLLVQFIFALLTAVATVWFVRTAWFPTVREAIEQLPEQGQMSLGRLDWHGTSPDLLAEGRFLAFVVDTNHSGTLRSPAQIQIEFGRDDIIVYSIVGYRHWPYPADWNFGFNRGELKPWWGAWEPPIQWLVLGGMLLLCLLSWALLATVYFVPAWLGGFFANRDLNLWQNWKLAGAALMPGALLMIAAIFLYGLGVLDLVKLAAVLVLHLLAGWVYTFSGVWASPKLPSGATSKKNPFAKREKCER